MKKTVAVLLVLIIAGFLLFGCTSKPTTTDNNVTASTTGQQDNLNQLKSLSDNVSESNDAVEDVDPNADIASGVE